jgi:hypothetical protein
MVHPIIMIDLAPPLTFSPRIDAIPAANIGAGERVEDTHFRCPPTNDRRHDDGDAPIDPAIHAMWPCFRHAPHPEPPRPHLVPISLGAPARTASRTFSRGASAT